MNKVLYKDKSLWLNFFLVLLIASTFSSCTLNKGKNIPDVSHIDVNLKIHRFEKDLFTLDTLNMDQSMDSLRAKYSTFADFYFDIILGTMGANRNTSSFNDYISGFINFPPVKKLYDTTMQAFPDLDFIEKELTQGFQYLNYYIPNYPIPKIYTMISEYRFGVVLPPDEHAVAIGLDLFFGPDYPVYYQNPPALPKYITQNLKRENIPVKVFKALTEDYLGDPAGNRLIDQMIHNGKKLYLLDLLLPRTPDSLKLEFTAEQTEWCKDNESEMWFYFISEELLYEEDFKIIRKFVEHSPHSPGMPPEAPGRTANFIGWQIVNTYMQKFPETTINDLLQLNDAQAFLDKAKYRP